MVPVRTSSLRGEKRGGHRANACDRDPPKFMHDFNMILTCISLLSSLLLYGGRCMHLAARVGWVGSMRFLACS